LGPSGETRRDCDSAKRWLDLGAGDVARCLRDGAFREQLRPQVDERFAAQLAATHNRDRVVLRLRGVKPSGFPALPSHLHCRCRCSGWLRRMRSISVSVTSFGPEWPNGEALMILPAADARSSHEPLGSSDREPCVLRSCYWRGVLTSGPSPLHSDRTALTRPLGHHHRTDQREVRQLADARRSRSS
jgi:hypothetical protein